MMLKHYYEKELSKLQTEAHLFSLEYPEHAASLNLEKNKACDPNVQRLLEGCAFLSAKIHQMVDEEADHLPEQLIQRLWPQLAESFPSVCIAYGKPLPGMQKSTTLPRQTLLQSSALGDENTICQFSTTSDLQILPVSLSALSHHKTNTECLSFTLTPSGILTWDKIEANNLSFYIDTSSAKSTIIIQLLHAAKIDVYLDDKICDTHQLRIIFPATLPEYCLNIPEGSGLYAQQLLFEAFAFPEKLQWFKIIGLETIIVPEMSKSLKIVVNQRRPINHSFGFSKDDFKLFAVPSINSFEHDCEPILLDHKHHRYTLSAEHQKPSSLKILSVLEVKGFSEADHSLVHYEPLHQVTDPKQAYYLFKQQAGNSDHCFLSFNSSVLQKESLSVRARVSNGHYPRRYIRPDSLHLVDRKFEPFIRLSNCHQPTATLSAESNQLSNTLLRQLRVQVEQIHSVTQLKALLTLLNRGKNPQIDNRIQSILDLNVSVRAMIRRGVFYQVQTLRISLDEIGFTSLSDCYVFGMLLHSFFQTSAQIATLVETTIVCHPSEEEFTWLGKLDEKHNP